MDKFNGILKNILVFLVIFLAINYILGIFSDKEDQISGSGDIVVTTTDNEYSKVQIVTLVIENNTAEVVKIPNECPAEPFAVLRYENTEWVQKTASPELNCESAKEITIPAGKEVKIPYESWNNALFSDLGRFKIDVTATVNGEEKTFSSNEFIVVKEGVLKQLWMGVFYRPIYNGLIFLAAVLPGHYLGLAIILLTIIIRTILLIPSQKAMKSQRRMQEIQPRLEKIKEKHKGDQQRIASETMALWKEAKVSPMSSCLPLLMQFPFLIAVYYVIQSGLNPDNAHLFYTQYENFTLQSINVHFLGLNLTKINLYVLPLIVGGLQFIQMKLTLSRKSPKNIGKKDEKKDSIQNQTAMAGNIMTYVMPVMIAVFTASLPAGIGIYWGTSTIYGIIQQLFVNRGSGTKSDEPSVRVINSKAE